MENVLGWMRDASARVRHAAFGYENVYVISSHLCPNPQRGVIGKLKNESPN
ncbi:CDP-glycerol:glycerophosphate glycerophosphotransferase [Sesbania bispinosa]|nr:CDP-glycerol:glycerophosphate glycerophosphotransferase [Sesbania bispinosa]